MPRPNYTAFQNTAAVLLSQTALLWLLEKHHLTLFTALSNSEDAKKHMFDEFANIEGMALLIQVSLFLLYSNQVFTYYNYYKGYLLLENEIARLPDSTLFIIGLALSFDITHIFLNTWIPLCAILPLGKSYYNIVYNRPDFFSQLTPPLDDDNTLNLWLQRIRKNSILNTSILHQEFLEAKVSTILFFALFLLNEIAYSWSSRNTIREVLVNFVPGMGVNIPPVHREVFQGPPQYLLCMEWNCTCC